MDVFERVTFSDPTKITGLKSLDHFTRYISQTTYKSKVVISQDSCKLEKQVFFFSHRSWQELIDLVGYVHEISKCNCSKSINFNSYPNEYQKIN